MKLLRNRRDPIIYGGKYSERYQNTFQRGEKVKDFPLSAKCRETREEIMFRAFRSGDHQQQQQQQREFITNSSTDSSRSPLLNKDRTKFPKADGSNATTDLNKQENTLIGYKQVTDKVQHNKMNLGGSPVSSPKPQMHHRPNKNTNIYNVNPPNTNNNVVETVKQPKNISLQLILDTPKNDNTGTLTYLEKVENIITHMTEQKKHNDNLQKFNDLLEKMSKEQAESTSSGVAMATTAAAAAAPIKKLAPLSPEIKNVDHILKPIKPSKEIEDLKPGAGHSDMLLNADDDNDDGNEHSHPMFQRSAAERKSIDSTTKAHNKSSTNNKISLNRTNSDVQNNKLMRRLRPTKDSRKLNASNKVMYKKKYGIFHVER